MPQQLRRPRQLFIAARPSGKLFQTRPHDCQIFFAGRQACGERRDGTLAIFDRRPQSLDGRLELPLLLLQGLEFGCRRPTLFVELRYAGQKSLAGPVEREHRIHDRRQHRRLHPLPHAVGAVPAFSLGGCRAAIVTALRTVGIHRLTTDPADEDLREEPLAVPRGAPQRMAGAADGLLEHPPLVDYFVGLVPEPIRNDPQVLADAGLDLIFVIPDRLRLAGAELPL